MSILDIGCGNGKPIAEYLQAKDFDVFGNDISEKLLHHAKNILDSDYVYCSDFRTLTIDKQFDAIICWYMLFHLHEEEHDNALKKMYNLLNDGGILCITFADTSKPTEAGSTYIIDKKTILGLQFGQTFYHSGNPASHNRQKILNAGFEVLSDIIDQPGSQVILARKIA